MRLRERTAANTWVVPGQGDSGYDAHGVALYTQGNDLYEFEGHILPSPIYPAYTVSKSGGAWTPEKVYSAGALTLDGSASVRYDLQRETNGQYIDVFFFDEDETDDTTSYHLPNVYYVAVQP